ncbi:MAG TPA: metallophosphoesterase [Pirellulales bacterium]|nr:metallophosphoesterase [Pirellulales bacterium]
MFAATFAFVALALLGHAAIWVGVVNRWHATGFRRAVVKTITLAFYAGLITIPLAVALQWTHDPTISLVEAIWRPSWATAYAVVAAAYGLVHVPRWAAERIQSRRLTPHVCPISDRMVDLARELGRSPGQGVRTALFSHVPGNQLWHMHLSRFAVHVPDLPPALEGLSVCHWSDLHLSGRIQREYFEQVVKLTNETRPDVIALTGDVCDKASLIDWIPELFGPATARIGKYFILGNHDLRTRDLERLRGALGEAGFVYVGAKRLRVDPNLEIAGDERPWIRENPPEHEDAKGTETTPVRLLLAHTPDRIGWARAQRFDLMLAGHTHGGQIRFPLVGPVICPSWHGTKYAAGFFYSAPTLMHVSRGTASLFLLRLNCPPEITTLVLTGDCEMRASR